MGEHAFVGIQTLRHISIEEEAEEPERTVSDLEPTGGSGGNHDDQISPAPFCAGAAESAPPAHKPVPRTRRKTSAPDVGPEDSLAAPQPPPTSPQASPTHKASTPSTSIHQSLSPESRPAAATVPLPPPPPPLPMKWNISKKMHTKPFHWDVVAPDKVSSSAPLGPGVCLCVVKVRKANVCVNLIQIPSQKVRLDVCRVTKGMKKRIPV